MSELLSWIIEHESNFRKARLPSLFSDFSVQRTTNPDGFNANIQAWQSALSHAARAGVLRSNSHSTDLLVLQTSEQLVRDLNSPQFGQPVGLSLVFDDAVQKGLMIPVRDFDTSPTSIYSKSWLPSPRQIINWGLRQIGIGHAYSGQKLQVGSLVIVANVEDVAGKVLSEMQKRGSGLTDRVMSVESFENDVTRMLGVQTISTTDLSTLLKYLQRDKDIISYDEKTIKFKSPSTSHPEPLTTQDATIASLKLLIANLNIQCSALSDRIAKLSSDARQAIKTSNRVSAQTALRSRKLTERTLLQRSATLHQLEEVYAKLEQAVDQIEIIRVMEASATTLKSLNKQIGGVERVEDVIEDLREEMGKVDEVSGVIKEPLTDQAAIDEGDLDDELEGMEKEQKAQEHEREAEATKKRLEAIGKGAEEIPHPASEAEKGKERFPPTLPDEQNPVEDAIPEKQAVIENAT